MSGTETPPIAKDQVVLLKIQDLASQLGISVAMAWRLVATDPRAPKRLKIGAATRFRSDDIQKFIEDLSGEATARAAVGAGK